MKAVSVTSSIVVECFLNELARRIGFDEQTVLDFRQTPAWLHQAIRGYLAALPCQRLARRDSYSQTVIHVRLQDSEFGLAIFEDLGTQGYMVRVTRSAPTQHDALEFRPEEIGLD